MIWHEEYGARAAVVRHSISQQDIKLATVHARYPAMIHREVLTHRAFSRNGRSSRAVPSKILLTEAENPYVPRFRQNIPGMTGGEYFPADRQAKAEAVWNRMAEACRVGVRELAEMGAGKEHINRPLEWFGYIDVLISTTDWANFQALRDEAGAQPEIQHLAHVIHQAVSSSTPKLLLPGEWHLPYISDEELAGWEANQQQLLEEFGLVPLEVAKRVSTARNARLTIRPFDGNDSLAAELSRYERLVLSRPVHASPAEHVATPDDFLWDGSKYKWRKPHEHRNFYGYRQHRAEVPHETVLG